MQHQPRFRAGSQPNILNVKEALRSTTTGASTNFCSSKTQLSTGVDLQANASTPISKSFDSLHNIESTSVSTGPEIPPKTEGIVSDRVRKFAALATSPAKAGTTSSRNDSPSKSSLNGSDSSIESVKLSDRTDKLAVASAFLSRISESSRRESENFKNTNVEDGAPLPTNCIRGIQDQYGDRFILEDSAKHDMAKKSQLEYDDSDDQGVEHQEKDEISMPKGSNSTDCQLKIQIMPESNAIAFDIASQQADAGFSMDSLDEDTSEEENIESEPETSDSTHYNLLYSVNTDYNAAQPKESSHSLENLEANDNYRILTTLIDDKNEEVHDPKEKVDPYRRH
jgi:hypothetical protein